MESGKSCHHKLRASSRGELKHDLPSLQIGTTRVFYKGAEHRTFEVRRDSLRERFGLRIQAWLRMRVCRKLYMHFKSVQADFNTALAQVDMEDARGTFWALEDVVRRYCILAQWEDSLSHIKDGAEAALVLLERQQKLLKKLQEVLPNRTAQGLKELEAFLEKADEIRCSQHPLVLEGNKVLREFRDAEETAAIIKNKEALRSSPTRIWENACIA